MHRLRWIAAATVVATGCFLRTIPDLTSGPASSTDAGVDALSPESDALVDANADAATSCPPSKAGPALVAVPATPPFCIDATEVTLAQYDNWKSRSVAELPQGCAASTSLRVAPAASPDLPATFPSWCEAYAFCAFAGKRLCTESELRFACSKGGRQRYPYGDTFDPSACNVAEQSPTGPWAAGSHASCEGAFPGIFDLVGNTDEWTASCALPPDSGDLNTTCSVFGGYTKTTGATCAAPVIQTRDSNAGFRCCAP